MIPFNKHAQVWVRLLLLLSLINCSAILIIPVFVVARRVRYELRRNKAVLIEDMYKNNILRLSFKAWNFAMGLGGIATVLYGILAFRVYDQADEGESSLSSVPWFFHAFLFVGIVLCAVTCLGHLAADTANTCCLSTYIVVILLLLILEAVIMTDAFLNSKWEKELPVLDDFKDSAVSSDYIWKCMASIDFILQAICVLLAALSIQDHNANYVHGSESDESEEEDDDDDDEQPSRGLYYPFARWQQSERYVV